MQNNKFDLLFECRKKRAQRGLSAQEEMVSETDSRECMGILRVGSHTEHSNVLERVLWTNCLRRPSLRKPRFQQTKISCSPKSSPWGFQDVHDEGTETAEVSEDWRHTNGTQAQGHSRYLFSHQDSRRFVSETFYPSSFQRLLETFEKYTKQMLRTNE